MNGIALQNFLSTQSAKTNTATTTAAAANKSSGKVSFASLLAAQMESRALNSTGLNETSTSSSSLYNTMSVPNMLASALTDSASGSESGGTKSDKTSSEQMKNLLLMMCYMMYNGNSSDSGSGLSSNMMTSLLSVLGNDLTGKSSSSANSYSIAGIGAGTGGIQGSSTTGTAIVQSAMTRLGDPYSKTYRGQGNYVDCSYLSKWAYAQQGIDIPSTAAAQAKYCADNGYTISKDQLQPGDLVFWTEKNCNCGRWNEIHHVAIYAGDGKVVEAKTSTKGVVYDNLWEGGNWQIAMYARPR